MTPAEHAQRIRQIELQLYIADNGMGMPRDYQRILYLRQLLHSAQKDAELELASPDDDAEPEAHFGECDCCGKVRALARTWMYGRMETWACEECTS